MIPVFVCFNQITILLKRLVDDKLSLVDNESNLPKKVLTDFKISSSHYNYDEEDDEDDSDTKVYPNQATNQSIVFCNVSLHISTVVNIAAQAGIDRAAHGARPRKKPETPCVL
jgi:hypothetical protein